LLVVLVLERTGDELEVVEVVGAWEEVGAGVAVVVVLGLTPATVQYWAD